MHSRKTCGGESWPDGHGFLVFRVLMGNELAAGCSPQGIIAEKTWYGLKMYYAPARPFTQNDWWQVECSHPLTGKVVIVSGDAAGKRLLTNGIAEDSQDGVRWHHAGVFSEKNGICEFKPQKGSRFIRVRVKNSGATDFAIRDICYYPAR